jgi:tripartite-type tricarboxylate transporter receptor subunit TctC
MFAANDVIAAPATDYFRGKEISVVIYSPAGGAYDVYARLLARHMPTHLIGVSGVIPKNMVGAGGLTATRYLYSKAPRDGTTFGTISRGIPFEPLLGSEALDFDPLKFVWLGSMTRETSLAVSWHTSSVKTLDDLLRQELVVAGTGAASDATLIAMALNGLVGTKFKIVSGYDGVATATLALERGEIEGIADWSWGAINATKHQWVEERKLNYLLQGAETPNPALPDVPLIASAAKTDDDRRALKLLYAREILARPFLAPPGIPSDAAQVLRSSFVATVNDPALRSEAEKLKMEMNPVSGEEVEAVIKEAFATPSETVSRLRAAMGR